MIYCHHILYKYATIKVVDIECYERSMTDERKSIISQITDFVFKRMFVDLQSTVCRAIHQY